MHTHTNAQRFVANSMCNSIKRVACVTVRAGDRFSTLIYWWNERDQYLRWTRANHQKLVYIARFCVYAESKVSILFWRVEIANERHEHWGRRMLVVLEERCIAFCVCVCVLAQVKELYALRCWDVVVSCNGSPLTMQSAMVIYSDVIWFCLMTLSV